MVDMYYVITLLPRRKNALLLYVPELKAFVFQNSIRQLLDSFNQETEVANAGGHGFKSHRGKIFFCNFNANCTEYSTESQTESQTVNPNTVLNANCTDPSFKAEHEKKFVLYTIIFNNRFTLS